LNVASPRDGVLTLLQRLILPPAEIDIISFPRSCVGNAYGAHSWAEAIIYLVAQPERPHFMTLTVLHWIPEDAMCAITLPLIAPTRAILSGNPLEWL
jgi:hypothetical protein